MALFCWARNMINTGDERYKVLEWMFAIPNGGKRGDSKTSAMIAGGKLKATGVKTGVSDIFLPVPRHGVAGLFIEMKRAPAHGGRRSDASKEQEAFGAFVLQNGFGFVVTLGWEAAREIIERYLSI